MDQKISKKMLEIAYKALDDKQAVDIKALDISHISVLADYFLIAHGNNVPHVQALIEAVDKELHKAGYHSKHIEGHHSASWILLDYKDIIIHIFSKEDRYFYDLERIWADGKEIKLDADLVKK